MFKTINAVTQPVRDIAGALSIGTQILNNEMNFQVEVHQFSIEERRAELLERKKTWEKKSTPKK